MGKNRTNRNASAWEADARQVEADLRQIILAYRDENAAPVHVPAAAWRRVSRWATREAKHALHGRMIDGEDADDAGQRLLLTLLEGRGASFDAARQATPYVVKRLRWSVGTQVARAARRKTGSLGDHIPEDQGPRPDQAAADREQQTLVRNGVKRLPEPLRRTIVSRFWQEATFEEIARSEGCASSTVFGRLQRAEAQLRGALDRESVNV